VRLGVQWTRQALSLVQDSLTDAYYSVRRLEKQLRNTTKWLKNNCKHLWEYHGADTPARPPGSWQLDASDSDEDALDTKFPRLPNYFKCGGCDLSGGPLHWESCRLVTDRPPVPRPAPGHNLVGKFRTHICRWCHLSCRLQSFAVLPARATGQEDIRFFTPSLPELNRGSTEYPKLSLLALVHLRESTWQDYEDKVTVWRTLLKEEGRIQRELTLLCPHPTWEVRQLTREERIHQYRQNRCVCKNRLPSESLDPAHHFRRARHEKQWVTCTCCETSILAPIPQKERTATWLTVDPDDDTAGFRSDPDDGEHDTSSSDAEGATGWCQAFDHRKCTEDVRGDGYGDTSSEPESPDLGTREGSWSEVLPRSEPALPGYPDRKGKRKRSPTEKGGRGGRPDGNDGGNA
jgi:hypothetical protein